MALLPSEQLHAMAEAFGDETAYTVVDHGSMTFAEWDTTATRLARGLVGAGVAPGRPGGHPPPGVERAAVDVASTPPSTGRERSPSRATRSSPVPRWPG